MPHTTVVDNPEAWGDAFERERARLVRLCLHLTHDSEAAEDLVQETLVKAWVHLHQLHDQDRYAQWLSAIARRECRGWVQNHQRQFVGSFPHARDATPLLPTRVEEIADEYDLEVELEHKELAELLDRALALLPLTTRTVLMESYFRQSPLAAIATRLSMSEGAVKITVHRGKLALRRLLVTELWQDTVSWSLCPPGILDWQETRIWCPICGRYRLLGRFTKSKTDLTLRCPACHSRSGDMFAHAESGEIFRGISGFKPALTRLLTTTVTAFRQGSCSCGGALTLLRVGLEDTPLRLHCADIACGLCHRVSHISLPWLVLASREGQRFWRQNPRIRLLPEREVEVAGCAALVTSFQSVTGQARFDVVSRRQTFARISMVGASPA